MFTAKDMWSAMHEDSDCQGIDDWLLKSIAPRLRETGVRFFQVSKEVLRYASWTEHDFKYSMNKRGFHVQDEQNCFGVTFPPQER
jgi:hypothetical protein